MAFQILLNLIIALIWMFLSTEWTVLQFLIGYLLGLILIAALRRFFPQRLYLMRIWAILKLLRVLLVQLVQASYTVIRQVVKPQLDIRPGVFIYKSQLTSDWELSLLYLMISLTPGSLLLEVSHNNRTLYIHAMNITDEHSMAEEIRNTFEKSIMEVTR